MFKAKKEMFMWSVISIIVYLFLVLKGLALEPDVFWQIKLGEWIVQNKTVISTDQFSWINQEMGINVFSHSWLGSVIIYLFSLISVPEFEYLGIFVYQIFWGFIFAAVLVYIVIKQLSRNNKDYITGLVFMTLPVLISVFPTTRPHMISNVLFLLVLYILNCWETNRNTKKIFFLPIISLIWANVHGGTAPMILVFMFMHLLVTFISIDCGQITSNQANPICKKKSLSEIFSLSIAMICSAIAMCINPYGFRILTYSFAFNNSACKEGVGEWQPSNLFSSFGIILMIMIVLVIILSDKKVQLNGLIDVAICSVLTLVYVRGTSYLGMATTFFFLRYLMVKIPEFPQKEQSSKNTLQVFLVLGLFIAVLTGVLYFPVQYNKSVSTFEYQLSDEMIATIKDNNFERLYNDYNIGGYLIYNEVPVFIDSRADLYPEDILREGKNLPAMHELDVEEVLSKYDFDALIVENEFPLDYYLSALSNYEKICSDDNYSLYRKIN